MSEDAEGTRVALALMSEMVGRLRFIQRAGLQYSGKRDIYKVAGYPQELQFDDYWALYERGGIAGNIVDMYPQTTWRAPPELTIPNADEEETIEFIEVFGTLSRRLRLWSKFERVDRLSGVGRYAILFLGVAGHEDAQLKEPLEKIARPEDLLYVSVFAEKDAKIVKWEDDPTNERFGLPRIYEIDTSSGIPEFGGTATKVMVHASRVIHVAEDLMRDEVFGRPRLQRVYNRLMDLEKVAAATGESFWQLASRILSGTAAENADISDQAAEEMKGQMEEIIHDLRRTFIGQGVNLEWLQSTPPDPAGTADFLFSVISGTVGIPKRLLVGSETGERASEQDMRHYLGRVVERQVRHAEPMILRAFIDRLLECGALPPPPNGEYEVNWPPLFEQSGKERAEESNIRAETARALTPVGGDPLELVFIDEAGDVWLRSSATIEDARERMEDEADDDPTLPPPGDVPPPAPEEEDEE